jgi:hypothetical protein
MEKFLRPSPASGGFRLPINNKYRILIILNMLSYLVFFNLAIQRSFADSQNFRGLLAVPRGQF